MGQAEFLLREKLAGGKGDLDFSWSNKQSWPTGWAIVNVWEVADFFGYISKACQRMMHKNSTYSYCKKIYNHINVHFNAFKNQ